MERACGPSSVPQWPETRENRFIAYVIVMLSVVLQQCEICCLIYIYIERERERLRMFENREQVDEVNIWT
jgi:hypothetical protein